MKPRGRQSTVNRFFLERSDDVSLVVLARDHRDDISLIGNDTSIVVTQLRSRKSVPTVAVADLAGLEAEEIGGPKNRGWAVYVHLHDTSRVLLVHSISSLEAQWLVNLLRQRYGQIGARIGFLQDDTFPAPPPPEGSDPWSVDNWRNQPPIG